MKNTTAQSYVSVQANRLVSYLKISIRIVIIHYLVSCLFGFFVGRILGVFFFLFFFFFVLILFFIWWGSSCCFVFGFEILLLCFFFFFFHFSKIENEIISTETTKFTKWQVLFFLFINTKSGLLVETGWSVSISKF